MTNRKRTFLFNLARLLLQVRLVLMRGFANVINSLFSTRDVLGMLPLPPSTYRTDNLILTVVIIKLTRLIYLTFMVPTSSDQL